MTSAGAPRDFPVMWPSPGAADWLWEHDALHYPEQLMPLEQGFATISMSSGFVQAARFYDLPIADVRMLFVRGWQYQSTIPIRARPDEMESQVLRAQGNVMAAVPQLEELWTERVLPEVQSEIAAIAAPIDDTDRGVLVDRFQDGIRRFSRIWELHFIVGFPTYMAVSEFDDLYRELFEGASSLDAFSLLAGQPNLTIELTQALWRLSRRASRAVRNSLSHESPAEVLAALRDVDGGAEFRGEFAAFLDRWGSRVDMWDRIGRPSWREEPSVPLSMLKEFARRRDTEAPSVATRRAAEAAEAAIADALAALAGYPAPVRDRFEDMLHAARAATVISEDHTHHIDFASAYEIRRLALAAGAALVADDVIDAAAEVFLLDIDAVVAHLRLPGNARPDIRAARVELAAGAGQTPPRYLGAEPPEHPASSFQSKFFGITPAQNPASGLRGAAGSAGRVTGTARIVHSLGEADRLADGDILVTETAAPPWSPLFATVAAIVTDTGGPLSHCAVVAREHGIPAVVGTEIGTLAITDGQQIEVDGNAGVVYFR